MRFAVVASVVFASGLAAQDSKKTGGPVPPTLEQPGAHHPMPIPRQNPVVPPDVRSPQHETGRERPVKKESAKKQAGKSRTSSESAKSDKSQTDSKR